MQKLKDFSTFARLLAMIIFLDVIWLKLIAGSFYQEQISFLRNDFLFWPGLFVWILIALGITLFVLPNARKPSQALWKGAIFGLVLYGVYDLTNYAIFINWGLELTIIDMLWGIVLCSFTSWVGSKIKE